MSFFGHNFRLAYFCKAVEAVLSFLYIDNRNSRLDKRLEVANLCLRNKLVLAILLKCQTDDSGRKVTTTCFSFQKVSHHHGLN